MDQVTSDYRMAQFAKLDNKDFNYDPTIKIMGGYEGKTHCMSISKDEYIKIFRILTDNKE